MMSTTQVKMPSHLHEKMKDLAAKNNRKIVEEYEECLERHITNFYQENLLAETRLEEYIDKKLKKAEDRLAGMLGRTGMDTSILVMAMMQYLSREFDTDRNTVFNEFRKQAAQYYSRPYQKQNDKDEDK